MSAERTWTISKKWLPAVQRGADVVTGPECEAVVVVEESRLREAEAERDTLAQALKPFSDAYERGVAGDNIWPVSDPRHYRDAYNARAGFRARGGLG